MDRNRAEKLAILHEGLRLNPYICPSGQLTIGIGRNLDANGISKDEALFLYRNDLEQAIDALSITLDFWDNLDSVRQTALVDMCFNLGLSRFLGFHRMLDAIARGDWLQAHAQALNSRWAVQVGPRAERISQMLLTGEWPPEVL